MEATTAIAAEVFAKHGTRLLVEEAERLARRANKGANPVAWLEKKAAALRAMIDADLAARRVVA